MGIINYIRLFADRIFLISLKNTFFFTIGGVVFITLSGLIMALLIQQITKGKIILRVAYFIPVVISEITFGLLWKWMLMPDFGLWNGLLKGIGIGKLFYPLLGSTNTALVTLLGVFVMKWAGLTMVIYLANIQSISEEIYEAAVVEGAGTLQVLFFITLPLLRTATFINLLLTFVWSFRVFDLIYVMTLGAPGYSTYVITLHMYNLAFKFFKMGYACSLSFFIFVIMITISIIYIKVTKTER